MEVVKYYLLARIKTRRINGKRQAVINAGHWLIARRRGLEIIKADAEDNSYLVKRVG